MPAHGLRNRGCAARVHGKHALNVRVTGIIGLNGRDLLVQGRSGRYLVQGDVLARLLNGRFRAVQARLDIQLPWCGYEADHFTFWHELNDALAQPLSGQKQVLPDIAQTFVACSVRVIRHDGDTRLQGLFDWIVKSRLINKPDDEADALSHTCRSPA